MGADGGHYIYPLPSGGIIVSGLEGGITLALEDLGFVAPGPVQAIFDRAGEDWAEVSLERLADLNADIVLTGYHERTDPMGAAMRYDDLDRMLPGWCAVLPACREGRMVAVPWNRVFPLSYRSLTETVSHLVTHLAGRPRVAGAE